MASGHEGDDHPLEQRVLPDYDPLYVVQDLLQRNFGLTASHAAGGAHPTGVIDRVHFGGAPAARPAVAIGTANPMPAKLSVPAGLARPSTIPIT